MRPADAGCDGAEWINKRRRGGVGVGASTENMECRGGGGVGFRGRHAPHLLARTTHFPRADTDTHR